MTDAELFALWTEAVAGQDGEQGKTDAATVAAFGRAVEQRAREECAALCEAEGRRVLEEECDPVGERFALSLAAAIRRRGEQ